MNETPHATFPPSANHRLIACPASHQETINLPVQARSIYAEHGTLLHDYCERGREFVESLPKGEDKNWCLDALDYVDSVVNTCGIENPRVQYEAKVNLESWLLPDVWGTADVIVDGYDVLHVIDYKFGKTPVVARRNPQLMTYAAGACGYPPGFTKFSVHIVQPPLNSYHSYEFNAVELSEFIFSELTLAIEDAKSDNPTFGPSEDACRFCRAAMTCKARYKDVMNKASEVFDVYKKLPNQVSEEDIAKAMKYMPRVERYFKELRIWVQVELEKGNLPSVPWKVVWSGKGRRKWKNEGDVMEWLDTYTAIDEDEYTKTILLSPAQIEKLDRSLKKNKNYLDLFDKGKGNKMLVKETDKREAIEPERDAETVFKGVANE